MQSLALYNLRAEITAFLDGNDQSALCLGGERDILLTSRLIL